MAKPPSITIQCEAHFSLSMQEVIHVLDVSKDLLLAIVDEGIVTPQQDKTKTWIFDNDAVHTIQIVSRLNRDLGINLAGAALVLDLLNEIDTLQGRQI